MTERLNAAVLKTQAADAPGCTVLHLRHKTAHGCTQPQRSAAALLSELLSPTRLPPIRLHDLRHTYASVALARGIHPKVVQDAMGHTSIATTMDLYSHVVPTLQKEA